VTGECAAIPVDGDTTDPAPPGRALALLASDFGRYYQVVHRYLVHRLFDRELAEELTAATFYRAVAAGRRFPAEPRHMQRWLLRTATNLANTHHRRRRRRMLLLRRFPYTGPAATRDGRGAASDRRPDADRVRAALMMLRPKYQAVVVLRFYSQLSIPDIALVLGCRPAAVRTRLSRAMKSMRDRLGPRRTEPVRPRSGERK
jgi:RNA polymerase sigma-70 factor (ECF subfamily)